MVSKRRSKRKSTVKYSIVEKGVKYANEPYIKISGNGERFWAKVVSYDPKNKIYEARVDNDLIGKHAFKFGDIILIRDI